MPIPFGFTKKAKLISWLKENPGSYRVTTIQGKVGFELSRSLISSTLTELEMNYPTWIKQRGTGRNTFWQIQQYSK